MHQKDLSAGQVFLLKEMELKRDVVLHADAGLVSLVECLVLKFKAGDFSGYLVFVANEKIVQGDSQFPLPVSRSVYIGPILCEPARDFEFLWPEIQ